MAAARVLERRKEAHRRAHGTHRRHVFLPHGSRQTGGSSYHVRPVGFGEPAAAKGRQGQMGLCRRMSMNNTWFSLWWTMWANNCDILRPLFERDNNKLAAAKFEPAVTEPCHREIVEFWWDAINTHKISPPGMTAYGRNEANAIFMAGEAAFTLVDSTHFGEFNDPKRSKIVGKVGMAPFPVGPRAQKPTSWNEIWGWAIPKGIPAERKKLAKEMLSAMMSDEAGQIEMW